MPRSHRSHPDRRGRGPRRSAPYSFSAEVLVVDEPTHFAWVGRTGVKGVFDGEHHFRLSAEGPERTALDNVERDSGISSPLMKRLPQMKSADEGFAQMNDEIRRRAEALHRDGWST